MPIYVLNDARFACVLTSQTLPIPSKSAFIDMPYPGRPGAWQLTGSYAYVAAGAAWHLGYHRSCQSHQNVFAIHKDRPDVSVAGDYLFLVRRGAGIRIFDISNPSDPQEVASYDTPGNASDFDFIGSYLYVADSLGLVILKPAVFPLPRPP